MINGCPVGLTLTIMDGPLLVDLKKMWILIYLDGLNSEGSGGEQM